MYQLYYIYLFFAVALLNIEFQLRALTKTIFSGSCTIFIALVVYVWALWQLHQVYEERWKQQVQNQLFHT